MTRTMRVRFAVSGALLMFCWPGGSECYSRQPGQVEPNEDKRVVSRANNYRLAEQPLTANPGEREKSWNDRLIRISGGTDEGDPVVFGVFFGPLEQDYVDGNEDKPGEGRYRNTNPEWECTNGYAILRGIRPSGSTQYIKATSDSTIIIIHVDRKTNVERVLLTEGKGAWVYAQSAQRPEEYNLHTGKVIIATIVDGVATIAEEIDIADDEVSRNLLVYLRKLEGPKDLGFE